MNFNLAVGVLFQYRGKIFHLQGMSIANFEVTEYHFVNIKDPSTKIVRTKEKMNQMIIDGEITYHGLK
jgi:hypothetical protein